MNVTRQSYPYPTQNCDTGTWEQYYRSQEYDEDTLRVVMIVNYNLLSGLVCTGYENFNLTGKFSSLDFQYLKIQLLPCTGTGCRSQAEIDAYFTKQKLSFTFTDYYFDLQDSSPVKMYVNDKNFVTLTSGSEQTANFFLQKSELEQSYMYKDYTK